jgi:hypothetical protein
MKPRTDNPALYRENVYKSWKLMHYVVSHVEDECFVAHLEPNPGVEYDCLSLITRDSNGGLRVRFMLNRNGVNANVLDRVWERFDEDGCDTVAQALMAASGLSITTPIRQTMAAQLCNDVVEWIEEHRSEEFCVGPIGWPGGCHTLLETGREQFDATVWPITDHGPELILGVDGKEVRRRVFEDSHQIARRLAVSIARCGNLSDAIGDTSHACHKVVNFQDNTENRHIPEAWFGNLPSSRVLLISSNPSIDVSEEETGENFPRAGWPDEAIAEWVTRRVDQTWPEVPVTFRHPTHKNFLWRCVDGQYRGSGKNNKPQTTWNNVHNLVRELLGSDADPSANYALTEVVHCKSHGGQGVPEASDVCSRKWLGQIMNVAVDSRVVVLLGSHVRPWARREFKHIVPSDFGARVREGGVEVAVRDSFVNKNKVYCYLPHPTASEPGGRSFRTRFGPIVLDVLSQISRGEREVPETTEQLHQLFRGV